MEDKRIENKKMKTKIKSKKIDLTKFRNRPLSFLWFVMHQKKWFGVGAFTCVTIAALIQANMYLFIKKITNLVANSSGYNERVATLAIFLILSLIVVNIFYRTSGVLAAWWITQMEKFAGQLSFNYLLQHSAGYFSDNLSGKLTNKIGNIARAMDALTTKILWGFFNLSIRLAVFLFFAFVANFILGVVALVFILAILSFSLFMGSRLVSLSKKHAEQSSTMRGIIVDVLMNVLATKQNVAIRREEKLVGKSMDKYRRTHFNLWWKFDLALLISNFLASGIFAVVVMMAIFYWQQGVITIGDVILFMTMLLSLYGDLEFLSDSINYFVKNKGKLQEGLEAIFVPYEIKDLPNAKKVNIKEGGIVFDRVNFHYKDDDKNTVFQNLSLRILAGQKIGLVGESGVGKSTFVSLLLRFMDVESGAIKVDGYDIKKIRQDDLRRAIAYVPQEALLFHRTLEENIKYSNPRATKKEVVLTSKRAYALDFINSFPKGFKTLVGERGVKLSGGQKQRVMIARAMLKKSPILILDEATSALDSQAERKIQKALETLMKNRTTIAIAHRLSTLKQMDRIIVFDGGEIVEDGTHDELLKKKGKYYQLWKWQNINKN